MHKRIITCIRAFPRRRKKRIGKNLKWDEENTSFICIQEKPRVRLGNLIILEFLPLFSKSTYFILQLRKKKKSLRKIFAKNMSNYSN